jgi:hypothetical protein
LSPDSILGGLARLRRKKKVRDAAPHPAPMAIRSISRFEGLPMIDALRMNVLLVALLGMASAVNGLMFYSYL